MWRRIRNLFLSDRQRQRRDQEQWWATVSHFESELEANLETELAAYYSQQVEKLWEDQPQ